MHALTSLLVAADAPSLSVSMGGASGPSSVKLVLMLTALSFAPAVLITMTCFLRFVIVFAFVRQALGVQGAPPVQVMTGLALFMTAAAMGPVGERVYADGVAPYLDGKIAEQAAFAAGTAPLRAFMLRSTSEDDLILFHDAARRTVPDRVEDVSLSMIVPAYVVSELRVGFQMGLLVLIPFLVIDLVVASVLMSLGMAMLSPALVSLPLKLLVFLAVDGFGLLVTSLMRGVG